MVRGVALAALLALSGAAPSPTDFGWDEIRWPLPRDAWPTGRAYRCHGCDVEVYVRPKLGFCNCTTGVTDDAEVDAVSDVDAIGEDFVGLAAGERVAAAGLRGRMRSYEVRLDAAGTVIATGVALSSRCDLVVAVARGRDAADRARIVALLDSRPVAAWIASSVGLPPP